MKFMPVFIYQTYADFLSVKTIKIFFVQLEKFVAGTPEISFSSLICAS